MLTQFKLLILSIFMSGNAATTDVAINMDNISNIKEVACLAQAVQGEAGNQPMEGKIAVAHVIVNRTNHHAFPETICGVIRQPGQFDFLSKVRRLKESDPAVNSQMSDSVIAALKVVNGEASDPTHGSLYFVNTKIATDLDWLKRLRRMVKIKDHTFYAHYKQPAQKIASIQ